MKHDLDTATKRRTLVTNMDIVSAIQTESPAAIQLLQEGPGFLKLGLDLSRDEVEDLKRRLGAKYRLPLGLRVYLAHRDEFEVRPRSKFINSDDLEDKPPHPVDYPHLIKSPRTPGAKEVKHPTYRTIKIRSPKFGSEEEELTEGQKRTIRKYFEGPIRYVGACVKTSRQRLVDGLTGKDGYPHPPNCACWYCGLFLNGPWHEHEAESRVDYGGEACRAMAYGLWTWYQRAMTDSDRDHAA